MSLKEQLLDKLYAKLPKVKCKGLCQEACGPIAASKAEIERLERVARKKLEVDEHLTCSMLKDGKCLAYRVRPLICRLYGVAPEMRCIHGCIPERWVMREEAHALLRRSEQIGGKK